MIKGGGPSTKALLDPAFRSALGYAIDKQQLLDKVHGGYGVVGSTQVPPVIENVEANPPFFWHTEPNDLRDFNIETAKTKLDEAGYVLNADGQRLDKQGKPINLHLVMPDTDPTYPQIAQFIQDWFSQLGIKVKSDVIEENSLYDIMLPPEGGDPSYKADFDMFIWSWYETVEPNVLLQVFLCDQIGLSSDSLWCNHEYDSLYDQQNVASNDQDRKRIIDEMQQLFYDQAPYHILYYDEELDAYRTDKFSGWQNQPVDGGYPLFSYSVIDYQFLTDAKAAPTPGPTEPASAAAGAPAPTGEPTTQPTSQPTSPVPSGGSDQTPLLAVLVVLLIVGVVGVILFARRGRKPEEEDE